MTVVPVAFQLASWIPAWWRADAGGDDVVGLMGPVDLAELLTLREGAIALTAYCPELGVGVLPGPKGATEAAVQSGQAVIVHRGPSTASSLLVKREGQWQVVSANPARPVDLSLDQAGAELAQAVVRAEHGLREAAIEFAVDYRPSSVRPLPPGTPGPRMALLSRAVRIWTAIDAVPRALRTEAMDGALHAAARATLAAYMEPLVAVREPRTSDRRLA
jgi:hypothetical protein